MSIQAPIRPQPLYEPGDLQALVTLLAEYTNKLNSDCDKFDGALQRRNSARAILLIFAAIFGAIIAYAIGETFKPPRLPLPYSIVMAVRGLTVIILGAGAVWLVSEMVNTWSMVRNSLRRSRFQIAASATQLERLVRRISPIAEHSKLSLAEKLELDLRLADADAALEYAAQYLGNPRQQDNIVSHTDVPKPNLQ